MKKFFVFFLIFGSIISCKDKVVDSDENIQEETTGNLDLGDTDFETPHWTDASHSKSADPDYSIVFPENEVKRLDIVIGSANWTVLNTSLASVVSSRNQTGGTTTGTSCNISTGISLSSMDYVPASVYMDGKEWYKVGFRFKGNKSLQSPYQSGKGKFSIKLKFNEFEDDYPQISGQRFYGFKKLNLANNYEDPSFMRDRVVADLFRNFGLVAARTAYYEIYIDYGSGSQYFGLYTAIEDIYDTAIKTQLGNKKGNLYKPEGTGASFAQGTYNEAHMEKKNNEDENDFSDVKALYDIINSSERTSNVDKWKSELESVFNVEVFLKWLAATATINNYDTYGTMAHNFYIYNHNKGNSTNGNNLMWIPWDHNEALGSGNRSTSFTYSSVTSCWPLIRYIMDQPGYYASYKSYVKEFAQSAFEPTALNSKIDQLQSLIASSVQKESGKYSFISSYSQFTSGVSTVKSVINSQYSSALTFANQ